MKILIIHTSEIYTFPPVISLIQNLLNNGHEISLITYDVKGLEKEYLDKIRFCLVRSNRKFNRVVRCLLYPIRKLELRRALKYYGKDTDIVWTTTDGAIRDIGKPLLNYRHIMQLMELVEDIPLIPNQKLFMTDLKKYATFAYRVVVPEINRAYIQKAWWELKQKPYVLPNKPYKLISGKLSDHENEMLHQIQKETRNIILYQGVFALDRNLDAFAEAIEILGIDQYCLYIMGKNNHAKNMHENLCHKYNHVKYLGYIPAPKHLYFTKYAYIGLLPYIPSKKICHYSILNAMYCAPNKIYEYSAFGVPMLGTDVAGLEIPFSKYNMGICCKNLAPQKIAEDIKKIELNYTTMSKNSRKFFTDTDLDRIVHEILYDE